MERERERGQLPFLSFLSSSPPLLNKESLHLLLVRRSTYLLLESKFLSSVLQRTNDVERRSQSFSSSSSSDEREREGEEEE